MKTSIVLTTFASTVLLAGAASAHGHGSSHSPAPPPPPPRQSQPAVSVAAAAQLGGRSSLANVAAAVKTPVADVGLAASVAGRGGTELSLDLGILGGGVGR